MSFLLRCCLVGLLFLLPLSALRAQTPAPDAGSPPVLLVLGDSLSAEYGLERGSGWVALLEQRLKAESAPYRVVNASVSGETTQGGVNRLPGLLARQQPAVVIIELGANDALRGLTLAHTEANLRQMVQAAKAAGAEVVLVGMQIPPNYGRQYTEQFAGLFPTVATDEGATLVPFLLEAIATDLSQFQADRIHPNEGAQPQLLETVWPVLAPVLKLPTQP